MNDGTRTGCARVRVRLAAALDGGLAPLEAALDRGHLEACAACRRERDEHARLLLAIRRASAAEPLELEEVASAVLARMSAARIRPRATPWTRHASWVAAAAAGLLLALFAALGSGATLRPLDVSTLDRLLRELPSWTDVVRGLDALSHRVS